MGFEKHYGRVNIRAMMKHNGCIRILKPKEYTAVATPSNTE